VAGPRAVGWAVRLRDTEGFSPTGATAGFAAFMFAGVDLLGVAMKSLFRKPRRG